MTEEMNELKTRVTDINKTVGEMRELMGRREDKAKDLYEKVDKIYSLLIGDGSTDQPSIVVRLDRVEQIMAVVKWACAAVVLLIINAIFERVKHG
jgi:hypothetical protein